VKTESGVDLRRIVRHRFCSVKGMRDY
jgi:hypothetical protein